MVKRKRARVAAVDFEAVDQYGRVAQKHESTELKSIPLEIIRPDPDQPRRILPEDLAQQLRHGQLAPPDALHKWQRRLQQAGASPEEKREMGELAQLAHSISLNGLISPITVRRVHEQDAAPPGVAYYIVTGERRYWAHWLLKMDGRE
ncbi:MAG: ParB N-terminal domain-containing protein, partial [Anaerolineales bacterium]|nr:ParB N-terminal domain-containing protein [Anaerolineales bacterium]